MDFGWQMSVFAPMATRDNLVAFARRTEAVGNDHRSADEIVEALGAYRAPGAGPVILATARARDATGIGGVVQHRWCRARKEPA